MTEIEFPRTLTEPEPSGPTPAQSVIGGLPGGEQLLGLLAFVGRRLALGALVLLAIVFLTYLGLDMAAGTEFVPALQEAVPNALGYIGRLLRGDLGVTTTTTSSSLPLRVSEVLPDLLAKSLGLLGVSLLLATVVGLTLGIWAAVRRHSNRSLTILLASIVGVSAPSFFVALTLQILALSWTRWTGNRLLPLGGFGWDKHLILPALVLAALPIAQITRMTFLSVSEVLERDFVRTARSKGLRPYQVMVAHVFKNAAVPILTTIGISLRSSLSSLPVVEFFFGWAGVGFILLKSISRGDNELTIALLLCLGGLFILVNVLLEGAYRLLDPRLRDVPEHMAAGERPSLVGALQNLWASLRDWIGDNALTAWWRRRGTPASPSPFRAILEQEGRDVEDAPGGLRSVNWQSWWRGTARNLPFLLGAILVGTLGVVFLFGPQLAPHSPYTTQGLKYENGIFSVPPIPPGEVHPWGTDVLGRDIMSLILAGAQQTMLLASLVVVARMLVGFVLGALAGWLNGSWIDRAILALAEAIAAFPKLLLAMILILALGIREGLQPFLIALCLVGWGEIMQFVRGEVMSIRPKPFIESAVAVGLRTPRIIIGHVLPNLLSALISLSALEMGAVLMLLGELGFIGIFIGGGAFADLDAFGAPYHYSDVPEWGSLLSSVRLYARAYPWTAVYPALAFFVAILGFNLFGEGIRRLIETVGVSFTRLLNRYTLMLGLLMLAFGGWVQGNIGSTAVYREQATAFSGRNALAHVEALTGPEMDGRRLGAEGIATAAAYIADQFEALGLQPAGEELTYFQTRQRGYQQLTAEPTLTIDDGGPSPSYRQDYAVFTGPFRSVGQAERPVRFVAMGEPSGEGRYQAVYPALRYADYSDQILMVLSPREAYYLQRIPNSGLLIVADDEAVLQQRRTLSPQLPFRIEDTPQLWITEEMADRLLAGTGATVAGLRREAENLERDELIELPTGRTAGMSIEAELKEETAVHVVGHLPGLSAELDNQLVIIMAKYDMPAAGVDGVEPVGANDNASGVALMLELIRTMQETGYQPSKTFLFVAYSGEGWESGNAAFPPDVNEFLQAKYGFSTAFELEAVVDIRGVGAGEGDRLSVSASGSRRLANLVQTAARRVGVASERVGEPVDISIVFDEARTQAAGQEAPQVGVHWQGWESAEDTLAAISADTLDQAGDALSLALMIIGRETQY